MPSLDILYHGQTRLIACEDTSMKVPLEQWQDLHVRHCRGEALSAQEMAAYLEGRRDLEENESVGFDAAEIRQQREELSRLNAQNEALRKRRELLEREIASLEASLSERAKQLLGVGS
jgi:chromosome segregation ATPase